MPHGGFKSATKACSGLRHSVLSCASVKPFLAGMPEMSVKSRRVACAVGTRPRFFQRRMSFVAPPARNRMPPKPPLCGGYLFPLRDLLFHSTRCLSWLACFPRSCWPHARACRVPATSHIPIALQLSARLGRSVRCPGSSCCLHNMRFWLGCAFRLGLKLYDQPPSLNKGFGFEKCDQPPSPMVKRG